MKIKPTSKMGGVLLELSPEESQIPAQASSAGPVFKLQKILVPVDFSDCSKKALQYAIAFARQLGAELRLLHVIEPYPAVPEMGPFDFATIQDGRLVMETLQQMVPKDISSTTAMRTGSPYLEIAEAAREFGADLILMATHGRRGFARMMLGSTTEKVVRYASCPVLTVREGERDLPKNEAGQQKM